MTSLRARLALLLVAAIVAVVVLAAFVTFQILDRPSDRRFQAGFAQEVVVISGLLGGSAELAQSQGLELGARPDETSIVRDVSQTLNAILAAEAPELSALVTRRPDGTTRLAFSLGGQAPDGKPWVYLTYPELPPSPFVALAAYLSLVVFGAVAVALLAASKITGPLRVLENAVASVQADGTLARLDIKGPVEIRATAKALNLLSDRLRTATESRMRLVAAAGHDLRTPMTRMRLRAEFLPEDDRGSWLHDLEELDRIADSAIRLVREETTEVSFEPISLRQLAAGIAAELGEIHRPVLLESGPDIVVSGQVLALKRAVRNLAENAVQYGGNARMRLHHENGLARLVVEDEGPGIPEALIDRVFEPFFRVDPGRRKSHQGAGLGLAIAREIVERHGGTITIENRREGGLRQTVALPAGGSKPTSARAA